jgi:hypothetical protein
MKKLYTALMFKSFLFLLAFFSVVQCEAQIISIGNGTSSQRQPFGVYWGYERSASVYTSTEVNTSGLINSLYWEVATSKTTTVPLKIYLKTDNSSMASSSWSSMISGATLVYSGNKAFSNTGWDSILLSTPYYYNQASGNLWVLVETNYTGTGAGSTSYPYFYYHTSTNNHQYWYQDNTAPTGTGTMNSSRPNIKINLSSYAIDAGVASIDTPINPLSPGVHDVYIRIGNYGMDTLFSSSIAWQVNGGTSQTANWSDTLLMGALSDPIYLGNHTFSNGYHSLKAWTYNPNNTLDSNNVNDTLTKQLIVCTPYSGTYAVGPTRNIKSFSDAVSAIMQCGVVGPTTFVVDTGVYLEQLHIPEIPGASATNTITFQSINADPDDVILVDSSQTTSGNNYTLFLDGADYIIFKDITLKRAGTNTYATVLELSNQATNNQFIGNKFIGVLNASTSTGSVVIYSSDDDIDSNNYFYDNYILNGSYSINFEGLSSQTEWGNSFIENQMHDFYYYAMRLEYQLGVVVRGNEMSSLAASNSTNYGLYLYYCDNGFVAEKNKIELSGSTSNYMLYVYYCDGDSMHPGRVVNNFISNRAGSGTNYGIYPYNSNYVDVFYNSVHLAYGSATAGKAIYPYTSSSTGSYSNIRIRNNILANTSGGFAIDIPSNSATLGYVTESDYNDLYSNGTYVGHYSTTNINDLTSWIATSKLDSHSLSINPMFKSQTDLHLKKPGIDSMASPIAGITYDIDGEVRNAMYPDIGADEYTPDSLDVSIVYMEPIPQPACEGIFPVSVLVRNEGYQKIDSVKIHWEVNNVSQTPYQFYGTLHSGEDTLIHLGNYSFSYTTVYAVKAFHSSSNFGLDSDPQNDTIYLSDLRFYQLPPTPVVINDTICSGQTSTLTASGSPGSYVWYDSLTGGNVIDTGAVFTTKALINSETYYVEAVNVPLSSSTIVISEVDPGTPDYIEIHNVSGAAVNTNGWKVICSDHYSDITDINTVAWNLPNSMPANQVLYQTDDNADQYWGSNLFFTSGSNGWVMILDNNDAIVDFLAWGWDSASLAAMSITYNSKTITLGNSWLGDGFNATCINSYQRIGSDDHNRAVDFSCVNQSKGSANTGINTPFPGGGYLCSSNRVAVDVIVMPGPTVDVLKDVDTICENSVYNLSATAQNYSSLKWTTSGDGQFSNDSLLNTTYVPGLGDISAGLVELILSANSQNCPGAVSDTVELYIAGLPTVFAGNDATICSAYEFALQGQASNYASIKWQSTGDGYFVDDTQLQTKYNLGSNDLLGGKIYLILKLTANSPCQQDVVDSLELNIAMGPVVNAGQDAVICENGVHQLNATAVNYNSFEWSTKGDGGFDDVAKLNAVYSPGTGDISSGSVELVLTAYGNPPCSEIADSLVITINTLANVNAGADFRICENSDHHLLASAANYDSVRWHSLGGAYFFPSNMLMTKYQPSSSEIAAGSATIVLTAYGLNPCPSGYDTIEVGIAKLASVDAGVGGQICANENFQLIASSSVAYDLFWRSTYGGVFSNDKILNPIYSPNKTDEMNGNTYLSLFVQSDSVCDYVSDSVELLVKSMPDVDLGNDTTLCADQTITLDAGLGFDSYKWSNNAFTSSITVDSSWVGIGTAIYWVEVTDNGCKTIDTILITFKLCGSMEDALGNLDLSIYPNPTKGKVYIEFSGQSNELLLDLFAADGRLLQQNKLEAFSGQEFFELDLSDYSKGIYFLKLTNDRGEAHIKLLLE